MNGAWICICSEEYLGHYKVLYDSLQTYSPLSKKILYFIGKNVPTCFDEVIDITSIQTNYSDMLTHICSLRARVTLDALKKYDKVVFLGAKIEMFHPTIQLIFNALDVYDAVGTPHILEPLPEDGKFPSNASVSFTGHLSTDYVGFKNCKEVIKFLEWQDSMMRNNCRTTAQTYLDQSWLNFLPFFVNNVYIDRDLGTNVAYWNMYQRGLQLSWFNVYTPYWQMKDGACLQSFQYSGLDLDNPARISRHQNRWTADGDILTFLTSYANRVKEWKKS